MVIKGHTDLQAASGGLGVLGVNEHRGGVRRLLTGLSEESAHKKVRPTARLVPRSLIHSTNAPKETSRPGPNTLGGAPLPVGVAGDILMHTHKHTHAHVCAHSGLWEAPEGGRAGRDEGSSLVMTPETFNLLHPFQLRILSFKDRIMLLLLLNKL